MYKFQMMLIRFVQFLGDDTTTGSEAHAEEITSPIDQLLDVMLVPLLILIGSAGLIYSIVLGVQYSKAENADKREEAKKRLINTIIGFVVLLVLLIILRLFTSNSGAISNWIHDTIDNAKDANK